MSHNTVSKPLEIKISTVVAVAIVVRSLDLDILDAELRKVTGGVPDYFENDFAVIDLGACETMPPQMDWPALISLFRSYRLNLVAVRNAPQQAEAELAACGLSIDVVKNSDAARFEPVAEAPIAPPPAAAPAPSQAPAPTPVAASVPALVVDQPVRAGQRIYAQGGDMIVTAVVNNGAELIADGSIHVYAPLRGRALAGARGDVTARIFTLSMEAELVSIGGTYRTFENGIPAEVDRKPTQIRLDGDRIDLLGITTRA